MEVILGVVFLIVFSSFILVFSIQRKIKKMFKNGEYQKIVEKYKDFIFDISFPNLLAESYYNLNQKEKAIEVYNNQLNKIYKSHPDLRDKIIKRRSDIILESKNIISQTDLPNVASELNFTAIDFETANRVASSVCALGIAKYENSQLVFEKEWHIKPTPYFFIQEFTDLHGFTEEKLEKSPTFIEIWEEILPHLDNKLIVAHNASFDINCLLEVCKAYQIKPPAFEYACTLTFARLKLSLDSYRLSSVARHFKIKLNHHNALSDAQASGEIFIKLAEKSGVVKNKNLYKALDIQEHYVPSINDVDIEVSFGITKAKTWDDALNYIQEQPTFRQEGEGKEIRYIAIFKAQDEEKWRKMFELTKNWKSKKIIIAEREILQGELTTAFWLLTLPYLERMEKEYTTSNRDNVEFLLELLTDN